MFSPQSVAFLLKVVMALISTLFQFCMWLEIFKKFFLLVNVIQWELMALFDAQYPSEGVRLEREKTLFLWCNYLMKYNCSSLRQSCYIPLSGWFGFWSGCLFAAYQACRTSEMSLFLAAAKFYVATVVTEQGPGGGNCATSPFGCVRGYQDCSVCQRNETGRMYMWV